MEVRRVKRAHAIRVLTRPPPQSIAGTVRDFLRQLGGPCWIDVPGVDTTRRRLVVTLLHGNEPSGIRALHAWLRSGRSPAVNVTAYVGSVEAALKGPGFAHRYLPDERDANRSYRDDIDDRQGRIAREFTARFRKFRFEALVDIHNNTGHNPAYGVGYGIDAARLNLTDLFGDWYMNSDLCMGTLVEMAAGHCPAISVECGRAGDSGADAVALAGLERFTDLPRLALDGPPPRRVRVLQHPVRVSLKADSRFVFADGADTDADLTLRADIDRHNFECLPAGVTMGWLRPGADWPIEAHCARSGERSHELFERSGTRLVTRRPMIPVMMTTDLHAARTDCLFYAMERA